LDEPRDIKGYRHLRRSTDTNGVVSLGDIKLFSTKNLISNMASIPEARDFPMGSELLSDAPPHRRHIPTFHLDSTEVTIGDVRSLENWYLPDGFPQVPPIDSFPLTHARYDYAVAFVERVGKRLPDEAEYEVAATRGGTLDSPWGGQPSDLEDWTIGPVKESPAFDVIRYDRNIWGLYSNALEWTTTWGINYPKYADFSLPMTARDLRVVRGGSTHAVIDGSFPDQGPRQANDARVLWNKGPRARERLPTAVPYPGVGFRCARSAKPRLSASDFVTVISK
jgi:formylglycine-generating enzyme required for sulfatase activity